MTDRLPVVYALPDDIKLRQAIKITVISENHQAAYSVMMYWPVRLPNLYLRSVCQMTVHSSGRVFAPHSGR